MRYILTFVVTLMSCLSLTAQELPERGLIRKGNREYNKNEYQGAIESYSKAFEIAPESFEARYNYANALHKAEQYEAAEELYSAIEADKLPSDGDRADLYYNLGNSQFMQQKYQEALESYKSSIRANPDDQQAKYNYAYTKKLLEDQQDNQDQDQDQEQGDGDGDGDSQEDQSDQDQDEGDQDQDEGDQNQDQNQDQEQEQQQQEQPAEGKISPQEQQQMLDAIQAQEDKTQEKLQEEGKGVVVKGRKNW